VCFFASRQPRRDGLWRFRPVAAGFEHGKRPNLPPGAIWRVAKKRSILVAQVDVLFPDLEIFLGTSLFSMGQKDAKMF
jgi:hypothetical protein